METVGPPPADIELHLVPDLSALTARGGEERQRTAGIASVASHVILVVVLAMVPHETVPLPPEPVERTRVTPLVAPPSILTQKDPNPGKPAKEFKAVVNTPRPPGPTATAPPPSPVRETPRPAPVQAAPPVVAAAPPPAPEVPKAEPAKEAPKLELPQPPAAPSPTPPQIQAQERPKSPFERPGTPPPQVPASQRQIPIPDPAQAIRGGGIGGVTGSQGTSLGSVQAGPGGNLELPALLSDDQGVDFKPYLTRLLATVKRNWMAVWPESAKTGRRGRVGVQFAIARDGNVTKVVFAFQSGADALDRAAVAAISMSNPLPPLPGEFKADRIVVQFNFAYNIPK